MKDYIEMGLFDEERKKMAAEAGGQDRSELQREAELNAVARKVSEDVLKDFGNKIEVSVSGNHILLQGRPGNTLEIARDGRNTFGLRVRLIKT
jgi:hypothetical protein